MSFSYPKIVFYSLTSLNLKCFSSLQACIRIKPYTRAVSKTFRSKGQENLKDEVMKKEKKRQSKRTWEWFEIFTKKNKQSFYSKEVVLGME